MKCAKVYRPSAKLEVYERNLMEVASITEIRNCNLYYFLGNPLEAGIRAYSLGLKVLEVKLSSNVRSLEVRR